MLVSKFDDLEKTIGDKLKILYAALAKKEIEHKAAFLRWDLMESHLRAIRWSHFMEAEREKRNKKT